MEITWHGQSCFSIKTKANEIVIDPFEKTGLPELNLTADICLVTHNHFDHANVKAVRGKEGKRPFVIDGPGEYEVGGLLVNGVPSYHDDQEGKERGENTIYVFEVEEVAFCHLGDLGQSALSDAQLEALNGVDVLMIPVGGKFTIDAKKAIDIISQIEPKIVVPMHYKIPGLEIELEDVEAFAKAEGISPTSAKDVLKVNLGNLPAEERETIILKPKR